MMGYAGNNMPYGGGRKKRAAKEAAEPSSKDDGADAAPVVRTTVLVSEKVSLKVNSEE